jgi:hypothetical protein
MTGQPPVRIAAWVISVENQHCLLLLLLFAAVVACRDATKIDKAHFLRAAAAAAPTRARTSAALA